ncbi:DUF3479 domain-containing protein [Phormidesmis priestleyi ANT.L61.2]
MSDYQESAPMSNRLPRLTLISSASPLGDLSADLHKVHHDGKILELVTFLTHELQDDRATVDRVLESIHQSDAVLFDLRGNPDRAVAIVQRAFVETQGRDIAFIPVFGGGPSVMALTRMGEFSMAIGLGGGGNPPQGTDYRKIKQVEQGIDCLTGAMSPEAARHAQNWAKCVSYWTNSGVENLANLLRFVVAEYAGATVEAGEPIVYPDKEH